MSDYTLQPIPYISFDGNCAEALDYYAAVFGGKIFSKSTFGEIPGGDQFPEEAKNKIVNAQLELPGGMFLYGGDTPPGRPYNRMAGLSLTMNFSTVELAEAAFNELSKEGEIDMPFGPTFWAEKFGMVTDKYGVPWLLNGNMHH